MLRPGDVLVAVGQLAHHPAGQDLLERAVEDRGRDLRVDVAAKLTGLLAVDDDLLERLVRVADLVDLAAQLLRASRDLVDEHADEVRVALPRTE